MPDWTYHPMFRPLLFRLPAEVARDATLGGMGTLASLPGGQWVIETMGHLRPPSSLQTQVGGLSFPSRIGLAPGLDVHHLALPAWGRLGFGFLELGSVTLEPLADGRPIERKVEEEAIWYPERFANDGVNELVKRLNRVGVMPVPIGVRLMHRQGASVEEATQERCEMITRLVPHVQFLTLDAGEMQWTVAEWTEHVRVLKGRLQEVASHVALWIAVPCDLEEKRVRLVVESALEHGVEALVVEEGVRVDRGKWVGRLSRTQSLQQVRLLREIAGAEVPVIAAGGVHEPQHALDLLATGANCVQLHSGPVYWGPGLPKRINDAMAAHFSNKTSTDHMDEVRNVGKRGNWALFLWFPSWVWALLLGIGMIIGGLTAGGVAVTSVVLPYDEAFLQMSREALSRVNPNLLSFMSHDRISLAGTMVSIGVLYSLLAIFALRQGVHWAREVLLVSAGVGFASFFLYLGFGYFDQLHALLSLLLLPCFLFGLPLQGRKPPISPANLTNDRTWRRAQWGQLLFVLIGGALIVAGVTISIIGMTHVFVPEDLDFLCTTSSVLQSFNAKLVPLIAHDRAGFGGALVSDGLAVLLISLWGIQQGARWVWWALLGAGLPGFAAGIGVHFEVGYIDFWHLFPAFVAVLLFGAALQLTYPYLHKSP